MATISKYQTASGATLYRVRYRTPDRRQTQKRGFRTKRDAQAFAADVEVNEDDGRVRRARRSGRVTVGELAPDWLARKQQATAPSHYRMLESAWRVHVQPHWGTVSVADVDLLGVEAWIADMVRKGAGATTVLRAHGVLSGILADAVKGKRLAANPAKGVENLPRKTARAARLPVGRRRAPAGRRVGRAPRAGAGRWPTAALRWGEAIALRVRDVEFLRRRLSVSENAVQLGVDHAVGPTKGRKARSVPVPEFVLDELSVQCRARLPAIWCSRAGRRRIFRGRSRTADGSPAR